MTEIDFPNLSALSALLARAPRTVSELLATVGAAALLQLIPDLARYPPVVSDYVRTGTLGRLWTSATPVWEAQGSGLAFTGSIANATPYGPYVQDGIEQGTWMDHWQTTDDVLAKHEPDILATLNAVIDQALRELHT